MGSCEDYESIFEIKDCFDRKLEICEGKDEYSKWRDLVLSNEDGEMGFRLTKPKAKRIIKELKDIFKIKEKVLSNSSPPVRTSNSTSLTSDKPKGFNMGLEVPTSSPPKSPTATSPNPNIKLNSGCCLVGH